jgi:hypothetical protein
MTRDELLRETKDVVEREVRAGFATAEEIREQAIEYASEEIEEAGVSEGVLEEHVDATLAAAFAAHEADEKGWKSLTDCDRLDAGFAELEAAGIVCRQNWTCCQTCGHFEIGDELEPDSRGYVFFHQQDTESAVEGYGLYLAYGARTDVKAEQQALADEVARTLREQGLPVEWDGSLATRMLVKVDWRKRRLRPS